MSGGNISGMDKVQMVSLLQNPNTVESLSEQLADLGLKAGMVVIVHSSLSSLGWVSGGPVAVVQAITNVVTKDGTVVMPTHSSDYTEPSHWQNPPIPRDWWPVVRQTMPAFDSKLTPTSHMGIIPEVFRNFSGALRSDHPCVSFAAWGKHAKLITENHKLETSLGEFSPLGRIYDLGGSVLLLGTGHDSNTSLHLAESRLPTMSFKNEGAPLIVNGKREWVEYRDLNYDADDFEKIGTEFERMNSVAKGKVGASNCSLFSQRQIVDFALNWMKLHRK